MAERPEELPMSAKMPLSPPACISNHRPNSTRRTNETAEPQCPLPARSLDHFVGAREQRRWDFEAERFRDLEIDDKREFRRLLHRQIARPSAFEDAIDVGRGLPKLLDEIESVRHQSAIPGEVGNRVDGGQPI